jgi:hypothetical protein
MFTDLKELRVRLECHFEIIVHLNENPEIPDPLSVALLSAIDLVKILEDGNWKTVKEALKAWESRSDEGRPQPRAV